MTRSADRLRVKHLCAGLLAVCGTGCRFDVRLGDMPGGDAMTLDAGPALDAGRTEAGARITDAAPLDSGPPDTGSADVGFFDAAPADSGVVGVEHAMTVDATARVQCGDALAGNEDAFRQMAPAEFHLAAGSVWVAIEADSLIVSGETIRSAFGVDRMTLRENVVPEQPPGTYLGVAPGSGAPGPHDTTQNNSAIVLEHAPPDLNGTVAFEFSRQPPDGNCLVSFDVHLTP